MHDDAVARAAHLLVDARLADIPFDSLPRDLVPTTAGDAYAIQDAGHRLLSARGLGAPVGFKIGCTTPVMQAYLGIDTPCEGAVLSTRLHTGHGTFAPHGRRRLGVECEIAVRLGRELSGRPDRAELAAAVASVHASIEVVEDRYVDYPALDTWTLVADDFFHAGLVVGPAVLDLPPTELSSVAARMMIDDVEVGSGVGSDILGDPLEALAWLVANRSERGEAVRAGDVVTLGSLVQTHWVTPGQRIRVENDRLGDVSLDIVEPGSRERWETP
jgi:2-keto-4-pentenoate hydratase